MRCLLGLTVLLTATLPLLATQDPIPEPERVRIETVDGVQLRGNYYAATKQRSPCVLLLHALGKDTRHAVWRSLAVALQARGHAVLAFDFRGHGESTQVDSHDFWSDAYASNRALVRGFPGEDIDARTFDRRYHTILANDIAAARAFLDRRNDQGECNSSNLILIGADTGATLGALWLNAECHRYRLTASVPGVAAQPFSQSEGSRILCAIWLDINPTLGGRRLNLPALLDTPGRQERIPQVFLYAQKDTEAQSVARTCERALKRGLRLPYTGATAVAGGSEDLPARDLLDPRLATQAAILQYLETVSATRGNEWSQQDGNAFAWRLP